jgi:GTP cyclohydrolase I
MEGTHLCKTMRGAKKNGRMTSSYLTGVFKEDSLARSEFMNLIKK